MLQFLPVAIEYRLLEPDEYPLLAKTDHGKAGFAPDPGSSVVAGAFDGDELVGCAAIVLMPHIEGSWIAEGKRSGMMAKRMEGMLVEAAKQWGLSTLLAYTGTEQHSGYMQRLDWEETPYKVWKKEI